MSDTQNLVTDFFAALEADVQYAQNRDQIIRATQRLEQFSFLLERIRDEFRSATSGT